MNAAQLLAAYTTYAAAEKKANAAFDLANFPDFPEHPDYTPEVRAGELIHGRGLAGALQVAEFAFEYPDGLISEETLAAYRMVIEAAKEG